MKPGGGSVSPGRHGKTFMNKLNATGLSINHQNSLYTEGIVTTGWEG